MVNKRLKKPLFETPCAPDGWNAARPEAWLLAADLRAGMWYFNIHTEAYPDGELRGQVTAAAM